MDVTLPLSELLLENMPLGVLLVDDNHEVFFQNTYITNLFETDEEIKHIINEKVIMCPFNLKECKARTDEVSCHNCSLSHHFKAEQMETTKFVISREVNKNGKLIPQYFKVMLQVAPFNGELYLFVLLEDITQDELLKKELYYSSVTDRLTGLYNRHYLDSQLDSYIRNAKNSSLSIFLIDVDFFKKVNDTYGHLIGDDVLIELSHLLKDCSRTSDIVARYGGEEIMFIFPDTDEMTAVSIADRIRHRIKNTSFTAEKLSITVSGGISNYRPGETVASMIDRADKRLYLAKQSGRDRIISQTMMLVEAIS